MSLLSAAVFVTVPTASPGPFAVGPGRPALPGPVCPSPSIVASPGGAIVPRPGCRVQFKVSTARPWYREIRKTNTDTIIEIVQFNSAYSSATRRSAPASDR